jgi:hypothetical protein
MIRPGHLLVLISALALSACGAGRAVSNAGSGLFESRQGACPTVGILADTEQLTAFNGQGRDLPDVRYRADINDARTTCDYGRSGGQRYAYSRVRLDFSAQLGSAARPDPVDIPYFVAVVERGTDAILIKETYTIHAPFDAARRAVTMEDSIDRIAIPVETVADGGLYEIIVGFELTPSQLEYNRSDLR